MVWLAMRVRRGRSAQSDRGKPMLHAGKECPAAICSLRSSSYRAVNVSRDAADRGTAGFGFSRWIALPNKLPAAEVAPTEPDDKRDEAAGCNAAAESAVSEETVGDTAEAFDGDGA